MAVLESAGQLSRRVFISYRREDTEGHVLALVPPLRDRFGEDRIFKDTDSIPAGKDFVEALQREVASCSVMLVVIGRRWLTIQDPCDKSRRLDDPADLVRIEVATALENARILVVPVLVGGAAMPAAEDLPPNLKTLARRQAFELTSSHWSTDIEALIDELQSADSSDNGHQVASRFRRGRPGERPREGRPDQAQRFPSKGQARRSRKLQRLLENVSVNWVQPLLENSLHVRSLTALGFQPGPDLPLNGSTILRRFNYPGRVVTIAEMIGTHVDELVAGNLLILGHGGSGKTTLLLQLAQALIARAREDASQPVPIVLSLSSWSEERRNFVRTCSTATSEERTRKAPQKTKVRPPKTRRGSLPSSPESCVEAPTSTFSTRYRQIGYPSVHG